MYARRGDEPGSYKVNDYPEPPPRITAIAGEGRAMAAILSEEGKHELARIISRLVDTIESWPSWVPEISLADPLDELPKSGLHKDAQFRHNPWLCSRCRVNPLNPGDDDDLCSVCRYNEDHSANAEAVELARQEMFNCRALYPELHMAAWRAQYACPACGDDVPPGWIDFEQKDESRFDQSGHLRIDPETNEPVNPVPLGPDSTNAWNEGAKVAEEDVDRREPGLGPARS